MSEQGNTAEKLMGALISKMEDMDNDLQILKQENVGLRQAIANPMTMLKKAGFVMAKTETPTARLTDDWRSADDDMLIKGVESEMPSTNEEFHKMDWSDIHELAEQAKSAGSVGNATGME